MRGLEYFPPTRIPAVVHEGVFTRPGRLPNPAGVIVFVGSDIYKTTTLQKELEVSEVTECALSVVGARTRVLPFRFRGVQPV